MYMINISVPEHGLRILICLRKSEVTVERISFFNVIENEHGIQCLSCSCTNIGIDLLSYQLLTPY